MTPMPVCDSVVTLTNALLRSCEDGDYHYIVSLLKRGANVEYSDSYGDTPLLKAIKNHHTNCVDVLLNNEYSPADTEHPNEITGDTPFTMAQNNLDIVRLLINRRCELNKTNQFKESALHLAVKVENLKVVKLLVSSGIDVAITNNNGETALHVAIILRNAAISSVLLSEQEHLDSHSAFLLDAVCDDEDTRKPDTFLQECMEYSVRYCVRTTVTLLIQHGTPVDASLLGYAYRDNDHVMVDTLIQAGLILNHHHPRFTPFIYFPLIYNDFERVAKYIKYVSPFAALEDGRSLLDVAYYVENCDMAEILLQNGHNLTFRNCLRALNLYGNYRYHLNKDSIIKIKHVIKYGIAHSYRRRTQFMPPQIQLKYHHEIDNYIFLYINVIYLMYVSNLINNHDLHHRLSQLPTAFNNQVNGHDLQNRASDLTQYPGLSRDMSVIREPLEELALGRLKALRELTLSPMSLLCITRNVICGSLGPPNMWFNIGLLPLPNTVKSFLRYDDILSDIDVLLGHSE
ncbi:hypothetical protein SNE40_006779 [Patella caerulea]|uniref:SOCS box domain-containing protein n=1 Tax=Patella caerulea TaxID=87958 RepID=A0AAN8K4J2_PATCE